jgi:hypothetical protein
MVWVLVVDVSIEIWSGVDVAEFLFGQSVAVVALLETTHHLQ